MPAKKKSKKASVKMRDLKPSKDAKGGGGGGGGRRNTSASNRSKHNF